MSGSIEGAEIVPFGKYRNQPVTALLSDRNYVDWLRSQPWLQQKQPNIYNVIIGAGGNEPQDTPEHNAMQARYIDTGHCARLAIPFLRGEADLFADMARRVEYATEPQRANLDCSEQRFGVHVSTPQFEVGGWDVVFSASAEVSPPKPVVNVPHRSADCPWCAGATHSEACEKAAGKAEENWQRQVQAASKYALPEPPRPLRAVTQRCPACQEWAHRDECPRGRSDDWDRLLRPMVSEKVYLHVELKPSIGDDFPAVLRQVTQRRERDIASNEWGWEHRAVVVADQLSPTSVTAEQVKQMFASRTVRLVLSSDLTRKELAA